MVYCRSSCCLTLWILSKWFNTDMKLKFGKQKKVKVSKIKKDAWDIFSKWVRFSAEKEYGVCQCVTCGKIKPWKEMQAGHFVPGKHGSVMFDELNVHPQCYTCNVVLGSNGPKYYKYMLAKYGQKVIDELERLDKINKQFKVVELEAIYDTYKRKFEELT